MLLIYFESDYLVSEHGQALNNTSEAVCPDVQICDSTHFVFLSCYARKNFTSFITGSDRDSKTKH